MSSRLGVTLGYDENSEDSNIYVVEVSLFKQMSFVLYGTVFDFYLLLFKILDPS